MKITFPIIELVDRYCIANLKYQKTASNLEEVNFYKTQLQPFNLEIIKDFMKNTAIFFYTNKKINVLNDMHLLGGKKQKYLKYISKNFEVVSLNEITSGKKDLNRRICITFDDGYESVIKNRKK